ncbi:hypothetical protein Tco_1467891 [Tanacetum coccineum]
MFRSYWEGNIHEETEECEESLCKINYDMRVNDRDGVKGSMNKCDSKDDGGFDSEKKLVNDGSDSDKNVGEVTWTTKGISALASRVGKHVVMHVVIASMCKMGVGRVGFARVLAEISTRKPLPYDIEVVYKNRAKECCVFEHFTHQCGKNNADTRKEESMKNVGMEKRKEDIPKQSRCDEKSDNDGLTIV